MRVAAVLAVLFGLTLIVANHAGWLATTILNTDSFVETLAPLPGDPDVSRALGEAVADNVIQTNEVGQAISDRLPEGLRFAAVPLTQGLRDLIADIATQIIRSEPFTAIWEKTLELTHRATLLYIRGAESDLIATEDGYVVLDLTEIGGLVTERLDELGFDALDGVELDLTIELFETRDGGVIQALANVIYSIRWFSFILTAAILIAAYAVATDRRRLSVWIGGATAIAMLVSLSDGRLLKALARGAAEDPIKEAGVAAAGDIIFSRFVTQSWIVLLLGLLTATVAWLMGDSERARSIKRAFTNVARRNPDGEEDESSLVAFVLSYRRLLEWGSLALVAGLLLLAPLPSFTVFVAGFIAVIVFVLAIEYIASSARFSSEQRTPTGHK
jgi:hypothetical protein